MDQTTDPRWFEYCVYRRRNLQSLCLLLAVWLHAYCTYILRRDARAYPLECHILFSILYDLQMPFGQVLCSCHNFQWRTSYRLSKGQFPTCRYLTLVLRLLDGLKRLDLWIWWKHSSNLEELWTRIFRILVQQIQWYCNRGCLLLRWNSHIDPHDLHSLLQLCSQRLHSCMLQGAWNYPIL